MAASDNKIKGSKSSECTVSLYKYQFIWHLQYIICFYHHLNRADYLLNYSFQHNTILDKNVDCDDPNDVENILEKLEELNF